MMKTNQNKLLGPGDPPPFTVLNESGSAKCLLICDHAGLAVPQSLNRLGLEEKHFGRHFAYDIGVRYITERLSQTLDAPAILGNYSRLVVDLNRNLDHPTAFVTHGEEVAIPGNTNLSQTDRKARVEEIYNPYHSEVSRLLEGFLSRDIVPAVISIHSFTPVLFKQKRPWEVAVLWAHDGRIPLPFIEFYKERGFNVGDNQPYDARLLRGSTVNVHADARGIPNALIELRHDLIDNDEKGEAWVGSLTECFSDILDQDIYSFFKKPMPDYDPEAEVRYFDELTQKAKRGEL